MKIGPGMLIIGVFMCVLVIQGFTQDPVKDNPGEVLFMENCALCHVNGGNDLKPDKPLKGALALNDFTTFLALIRTPRQPMPPFPLSQISDEQAKVLYDYILAARGTWK